MTAGFIWLIVFVVLTSVALTYAIRKYAVARHVVDVPTSRGSHQAATPRGGGLAIAITFLAALIVLYSHGYVSRGFLVAALGAGGVAAGIGFADDHRDVRPVWRLLLHFCAAAWLLYWMGGAPILAELGSPRLSYWLWNAVFAAAIVWSLNLYNFMDGIDGIASVEAITTCAGGALIYLIASSGAHEWAAPILLAAAAAGFLYWNLPPARIFMGDAGSGFLGIIVALLCLQAALAGPGFLFAWVILLGVFVVDSAVTLIRRAYRGCNVLQPHRSHAYQVAARRFESHGMASTLVGLINLLWLLPIAMLVATSMLDGWLGVAVAYIPLVGLALHFNAGGMEE